MILYLVVIAMQVAIKKMMCLLKSYEAKWTTAGVGGVRQLQKVHPGLGYHRGERKDHFSNF